MMSYLEGFPAPPGNGPYLRRLSYSDWSSGHNHILHTHEELSEFLLILQGRGEFTLGLYRAEVQAGDVVLVGEGVPHDELPQSEGPYETLCIGFSRVRFPGCAPGQFLSEGRSPVFHRPPQFAELAALGGIIHRHAEEPGTGALCQHLALGALELVAQMTAQAAEAPLPEQADLVARLEAYLNEHYREDLTIERLSRLFYVSPSGLSHLFKERMGYSLKQYILRRRIGEAQTRLYTTQDSVQKIAAESGFEDAAYFSRLFTKYVGLPPVEYRKFMHLKR